MERVVVFPAPLGPTSPMNFPAGNSRSIPATATCCPNRFQSPCTRTAADVIHEPYGQEGAPIGARGTARATTTDPQSPELPIPPTRIGERRDQLLRVRQPPVRSGRPTSPLHSPPRPEPRRRRGHIPALTEHHKIQRRGRPADLPHQIRHLHRSPGKYEELHPPGRRQ